MKYYSLLLACKNTVVILLDNANWIISKVLYIFLNIDLINLWYLSNNELLGYFPSFLLMTAKN